MIHLENTSKFYRLYASPKDRLKEALHPFGRKLHREFYALKDVSLEVRRGEILGIVGRNGSGKSTLLKIIAGVVPVNSGRVAVNGRVSALLDLNAGMNPDLDGIQNVRFGGLMLGFSHEQMRQKLDEIVAFADIGDFIRQPLKTYSSGMRTRLGFALAVHVDPEILVVDEVLAVGDALFQRKCYARMEAMFRSGCTVLYVSHNASTVNELCTRAILLEQGELLLDGPPKLVTNNYERLLFAKPEQGEALRAKLRHLQRREDEKRVFFTQQQENDSTLLEADESARPPAEPPAANQAPATDDAEYLPSFVSKSEITHRTAGVEIEDVYITTRDGWKVNHLVTSDDYRLRLAVSFSEEIRDLAFSCVVKTEKGIVLSGLRHPARQQTLDKAPAGKRFLVTWSFHCPLLSGSYFVDVGVVQQREGERNIVAARYDAYAFRVRRRVSSREPVSSWGYLTLQPRLESIEVGEVLPGSAGGNGHPA